jgi:preprotein translocase subunit SecA
MNKQREAIYKLRRDILEGREGRDYVMGLAEDILDGLLDLHCPEKTDPQDWDLTGLRTEMLAYFNINAGGMNLDELGIDELRETLWKVIEERYAEKESRHDPEVIRGFERAIMLQSVDTAWKDHLLALDHLKEGIGLRGYGQRDPLQEYKKESFDLFDMMRERVENDIVQKLFRFEPMTEEQVIEQRARQQRAAPRIELSAPPKVEGQRPQQPAANRVLRVAPHADLRTLDPVVASILVTRMHGTMIYETLFSWDAQLNPQPQMVDHSM